jgi:plasmid rolling circle replication initiator protein Rep
MNKYNSEDVKKQGPTNLLFAPAEGVELSTYSPGDKPWDVHRKETEDLTMKLEQVQGDNYIARQAERMSRCAPWLVFATKREAQDELVFKLHRAEFCRVRTCPVCQWRRSLLTVARVMSALPKVMEEYPTMRLIHLVLTVRNVSVTELRSTISDMNSGFKRMIERVVFKRAVRGFIRSIEVTRGIDGTAHPHFHIMLAVPSSYFKNPALYIKHDEWRDLWADCMRLDYLPQVSIQAFRTATPEQLEKAVYELAKYTTKPSDLIGAPTGWLVEYIHQIHRLRFLSSGGVFKDALAQADEEYQNENLITVGEKEAEDATVIRQSLFDWHGAEVARYKHTKTRENPELKLMSDERETVPRTPPGGF